MLRVGLLLGGLLLSTIASAQPVHQPIQGFYINLETGTNGAGSLVSGNETSKVYTNLGLAGLVDFGWRFGNGLRAEIEGSYRANDVDGISTLRGNGLLQPLMRTSGIVRTYAIMANIAYDLPFHPFGLGLRPYVGAGLGYGWLDLHDASGNGYGRLALSQGNTYTGPTFVSFGSAGAFASQVMVGASLPLRILPGLEANLEYRFFGMARADVPLDRSAANDTNRINGGVPFAQYHNGFEVHDNTILIGLRYTFGPHVP